MFAAAIIAAVVSVSPVAHAAPSDGAPVAVASAPNDAGAPQGQPGAQREAPAVGVGNACEGAGIRISQDCGPRDQGGSVEEWLPMPVDIRDMSARFIEWAFGSMPVAPSLR